MGAAIGADCRWLPEALPPHDLGRFVTVMAHPLITAVVLLVALCRADAYAQEEQTRPENWAQPVALNGDPNLFRISDRLYRSAQPTAEGMWNLKKRGIVTVINLRSFHSDRDEIGTTGLAYEHIYMKAWHPERKEAVRFLQIVTDSKRTPVLVHCQQGADRTGAMAAIYRIAVQGWSKEDAIAEMRGGEFGFNEIWINLPGWIRDLDIDAICRDAGIEHPTECTKD